MWLFAFFEKIKLSGLGVLIALACTCFWLTDFCDTGVIALFMVVCFAAFVFSIQEVFCGRYFRMMVVFFIVFVGEVVREKVIVLVLVVLDCC